MNYRLPFQPSSFPVKREPLSKQAFEVLQDKLKEGVFGSVLPSERKLAASLQVSRMTLRSALEELERQGRISSGRGKRRLVIASSPMQGDRSDLLKVILLSPISLQEMEPQMVFIVHRLSECLLEKGIRLEVEVRLSCFSGKPCKALARLVDELKPEGWILFRSNEAMQEWFGSRSLPFVIVGSAFTSDIPSFGSEHAAVSAHAAAQFIRLGHWRGVVLAPRRETPSLGDRAVQEGFRRAGFPCKTLYHDRTREGILRAVDSILSLRPQVTAIFSAGGQYSLAVLSGLLNRRVRIPDELSILVMGHDPVFQYFSPSPAHYQFSVEKFAKQLFRLVWRVVFQKWRRQTHMKFLPEFVPGETLGKAPMDRDYQAS